MRSIVPAAVLSSRSACRDLDFTQTVDLLLVDGAQCDMITVERDTIVAWKHGSVDAGMLRRHKLLDAADSQRVVAVGADPAQQSTIQSVYGDVEFATESTESHLVHGAELCLANQSQRWFDLRREQLGPSDPLRPIRREIRLVTFAAAACLLAMVVGGWWRTQRIEAEIAGVRLKQQQLFQTAFPDTQVPGAIVRRVRSEHARVMGSRGASAPVDVPMSAPDVLRELLAALPENIRFRIDSIQIFNGQLDLDLLVRSPVDAGVLATSLSSAGFVVDPPVTTQKDAKTFESVLEAQWVGRGKKPATRADVSVRISIRQEVAG